MQVITYFTTKGQLDGLNSGEVEGLVVRAHEQHYCLLRLYELRRYSGKLYVTTEGKHRVSMGMAIYSKLTRFTLTRRKPPPVTLGYFLGGSQMLGAKHPNGGKQDSVDIF